MIYDCVHFNGEFELLRIRHHELSKLGPVLHLLAEADKTQLGDEKPFSLASNRPPNIKIELIRTGNMRDIVFEQWRALKRLLDKQPVKNDDLIIVSDVDEIPRASALKQWHGKLTTLSMHNFTIKMNLKVGNNPYKTHAVALRGSESKKRPIQWLRNWAHRQEARKALPNAGWHFSCVGRNDQIYRRDRCMKDFPQWKQNPASRVNLMDKGWSALEVHEKNLERVAITKLPSYVRDNKRRLIDNHLILDI